jgi:hypothetical protein
MHAAAPTSSVGFMCTCMCKTVVWLKGQQRLLLDCWTSSSRSTAHEQQLSLGGLMQRVLAHAGDYGRPAYGAAEASSF